MMQSTPRVFNWVWTWREKKRNKNWWSKVQCDSQIKHPAKEFMTNCLSKGKWTEYSSVMSDDINCSCSLVIQIDYLSMFIVERNDKRKRKRRAVNEKASSFVCRSVCLSEIDCLRGKFFSLSKTILLIQSVLMRWEWTKELTTMTTI